MAALQRGGTEEAIPFCNVRALPLTDSMALVYRAKIKRVTNRARNPLNTADEFEAAIIEQYGKQLTEGQTLHPRLRDESGNYVYYFPITTNAMCLQCHGTPGVEVKEGTLEKLQTYYPQDKALHYGPEQIRGLWKVIPDPSK